METASATPPWTIPSRFSSSPDDAHPAAFSIASGKTPYAALNTVAAVNRFNYTENRRIASRINEASNCCIYLYVNVQRACLFLSNVLLTLF